MDKPVIKKKVKFEEKEDLSDSQDKDEDENTFCEPVTAVNQFQKILEDQIKKEEE